VKPGTVVPAFLDSGDWSACFGESLLHLLMQDACVGQGRCVQAGAYLREMTGTGGIPEGRNRVVEVFLADTQGEWLWMVDTDMGFLPDTVERLLASADPVERPIMGGLAFAHRRLERTELGSQRFGIIPTLYQWADTGAEVGFAPMPTWPRDQVVQVGGTGAACLLMHRGALEQIRDRYGPEWFLTITHPSGLPGGRPRTFSEDFSFCVRAAGAGLPVHVDTSVQTVHHKGEVYLDLAAYDQQQARTLGTLQEGEEGR